MTKQSAYENSLYRNNGRKENTTYRIAGQLVNAEDSDLVHLLLYATNDEEEAGEILRECLTKNKKLLAIYPGLGDKAPQNATLIGSIIDGSLYLV